MLDRLESPAGPTGEAGPIRRRTIAEEVADRIIMAIAARDPAPGDRVVEQEIAARFGVSRIPVREAMHKLETQGVLTSAPRRGTRVAPFDERKIDEVYEVRVAMEKILLRHALPRFAEDPSLIEPLDRLIAAMGQAGTHGDTVAVNRADLDFHRHIAAVSGHGMARTLWEGISRHVQIIFGMELYRDPDVDAVVRQHVELRDLIAAGRVDAVDEAIEQHIAGYRSLVWGRGSGPASSAAGAEGAGGP
ncbi:MAG: GntR family transcriptional regulator [Azospirillaceae bacterium]